MNLQRELTRERAFPTIGVILLGGISDEIRRYPRHTSAGITYTSPEGDIYSETSLIESEEPVGLLDGKTVGKSYRSPFTILEKYRNSMMHALSSENNSIGFISTNSRILSGSSDSGAAALGAGIKTLSGTVNETELENDLRTISESVGRSLKGGLTITEIIEGVPVTEQLLPKESFSGFSIVGCRFPEKRKPSDVIHSNIVKSDRYQDRIRSVEEKGELLKELAVDRNIEGIFELSHSDTDEYHELIESVGVNIINTDMRRFMKRVNQLRNDFWCSYIVTGGTNVFVAAHEEDVASISEEAEKYGSSPVELKIGGPPINVPSLS